MRAPEDLLKVIEEGDKFVVASHMSPEADALGSVIALGMALRAMGKTVVIFNRDMVPNYCAFLPGAERVTGTLSAVNTEEFTLLLLDCNTPERAALEDVRFRDSAVIDHHMTETGFGDVKWVEPKAPATGLMVFRLLEQMGADITPDIATNLYAAIAVDTGTFRHLNTTAESLSVAAELAEAGAEPGPIASDIYESWSLRRFNLLCVTLGSLEIHGPVAVISVTLRMLKQTGTTLEDTEEFANLPCMIKDVKVSAFLKEVRKGYWRVSLRSKEKYNVASIAGGFGGGGHRNASGFSIKGEYPGARDTLLKALGKVL